MTTFDAPEMPKGSPGASGDTALRCFTCGYNLTGAVNNRCPECGSDFDRDTILAQRAGEGPPSPVPIWDERRVNGICLAYFQIAWRVMFRPGPLARRFLPNPDWSSARVLGRCSYGIAAALTLAGALISQSEIVGRILLSIAWLVGAYTTERAASIVFPNHRCVERPNPRARSNWTRTLVGLGSCFLVINAIIIAGGFMNPATPVDLVPPGAMLLFVVACLWWWMALFVVSVNAAGWRGCVTLITLPLAAGIGFGVGALTFFMACVLTFRGDIFN
ncbi:MAG TPA: hypothetical protein P5572_01900 [Phycisphaerae bacterium]|nr:hypothetical protein [Phycisphaerales bacterium]HRX83753.1 hypothetical protein [Phycisphaerae bacterium]